MLAGQDRHQIRVHLAASGLPIWGDPVYGKGRAPRAPSEEGAPAVERPALHAAVLGFRHPIGSEALRFEAPLPDDLAALVCWLRECEA